MSGYRGNAAAYAKSRESFRANRDRVFWTLVTIVGDCWEWQGARQTPSAKARGGYGWVRRFGKHIFAHRYAYTLVNGPIPDGLLILHSCDNPPCINPAHLRAGTQSENIIDSVERGRHWARKAVAA